MVETWFYVFVYDDLHTGLLQNIVLNRMVLVRTPSEE